MQQESEGIRIKDGVFGVFGHNGDFYAMKTNIQDNGGKFEYPKKIVSGGIDKGVVLDDYSPGHANLEFPGGVVEEGESLTEAFFRELHEELRELLVRTAIYDTETFAQIFAFFNLVSEEADKIENFLVYQIKKNNETGEYEPRGVYRLHQFVVELSDEQHRYLMDHDLIFEINQAVERGMTFRPYVHGLIYLTDFLNKLNLSEGEYEPATYLN